MVCYEIPNSNKDLVDILKLVPDEWRTFETILTASEELYNKEQVLKNTRLVLCSGRPSAYGDVSILGFTDAPFEKLQREELSNNIAHDRLIKPNIPLPPYNEPWYSSVEIQYIRGSKDPFIFSHHDLREYTNKFIMNGYKGYLYAASEPPENFIHVLWRKGVMVISRDKSQGNGTDTEEMLSTAMKLGFKESKD